MFHLRVEKLAKRFGSRKVFSDIAFDLATGESLAVVGRNGSGKTTLVMTLLGGYRPSNGAITYEENEVKLDEDAVRRRTSLVAPYINLYDTLTAEENLVFFSSVHGSHTTGKEINSLLVRVGLEGRGADLVGSYSSGMKQRLKYAVALLKCPAYLFLDEPTANLDDVGKQMVFDLINEYRQKAIVVIATNEKEEYALASKRCEIAQ